MTEKRRLEMAAAAMKARITTRKSVRLFLSPTGTKSRDWADIVVGVGILWTSVVLRSSTSCSRTANRGSRRTAWSLRRSRHSGGPSRSHLPQPLYPSFSRSATAGWKMLRFFPSCFSNHSSRLPQAVSVRPLATKPTRVNWHSLGSLP